jgi:hypothetical protein
VGVQLPPARSDETFERVGVAMACCRDQVRCIVHESIVSADRLAIYWFTGTAGSAAGMYYENMHSGLWPTPSTTPTGVAVPNLLVADVQTFFGSMRP